MLLWLALVLSAAVLARRLWPGQRELSRKLVHMGAGLALPIAWATAIPLAIALPAALGATLVTALNHRFRLLPAVEDVGRHSWGTIAYGASISLLLALYWPSQPALVSAGVLTMALGDGLAGLVGASLPLALIHICRCRRMKRLCCRWPPHHSTHKSRIRVLGPLILNDTYQPTDTTTRIHR